MIEEQVFPSSAPGEFLALIIPIWEEFILWQKNMSVLIDILVRHCNNAVSNFIASFCWGAPSGAPYFCPEKTA